MLIAEEPDEDWLRGFYLIYQTFLLELKLFCWSAGFAWPKVSGDLQSNSLPAIVRIGSRGNCQSMVSDVSSLELYSVYNVNSNPFATMKAFMKVMSKNL